MDKIICMTYRYLTIELNGEDVLIDIEGFDNGVACYVPYTKLKDFVDRVEELKNETTDKPCNWDK